MNGLWKTTDKSPDVYRSICKEMHATVVAYFIQKYSLSEKRGARTRSRSPIPRSVRAESFSMNTETLPEYSPPPPCDISYT